MNWIPIDEMPQTGEQVLFYSPAGMFIAPAVKGRELSEFEKVKLYRNFGTFPNVKYNPMYYMPLPAPPTNPGGGE